MKKQKINKDTLPFIEQSKLVSCRYMKALNKSIQRFVESTNFAGKEP